MDRRRRAAPRLALALRLSLAALAPACGDAAGASAPAAAARTDARATVAPTARAISAPAQVATPDPVLRLPPEDAAVPHPAVACLFVARRLAPGADPVEWEWRLWRSEGRVESREDAGFTGEVWTFERDGRLTGHDRVFHRERRVLEYAPGDLAAVGFVPDRERLLGVVHASSLGRELAHGGDETWHGLAAARYAGTTGGAEVEVLWLPRLRLPARVRRVAGDGEIVLELREVHPLAASPWAHDEGSRYHRVDFADLGDRPRDPLLRRLAHSGVPGASMLALCCPPGAVAAPAGKR
jgi:hypothetical protein